MTTLDVHAVDHIAMLARLALTDEEKTRYAAQLSSILEYAARLQSLDTASISPTFSVLPPQDALRADEPRPALDRDALLRNAPQSEDNQFRLPPVFD
jgi:aspartyl-tRNA(Asn)/glutamyl-tRNA(Gln) amidotransferase subunit C